jgi:hypothetical protein
LNSLPSISEDGALTSAEAKGAAAPATAVPAGPLGTAEMFTHDEIVTLRLIFSLFDDNGDDYVDMQELMRYAEETGTSRDFTRDDVLVLPGRMRLAYT